LPQICADERRSGELAGLAKSPEMRDGEIRRPLKHRGTGAAEDNLCRALQAIESTRMRMGQIRAVGLEGLGS